MADMVKLLDAATGNVVGASHDVSNYDRCTVKIQKTGAGSCALAIQGKFKFEEDADFETLYLVDPGGTATYATFNLAGVLSPSTRREFQLSGINEIRAVITGTVGAINVTVKLGATHRN